ncbi:MAG: metallophosphoesterase [Actinomycetales bacterium]|nr:metallophosphoesterase [Actinomycetales bacterium]
MSRALRGLGVLAAAGAGALAWSLVEAQWYTLREASVPVLPPGALPLRVLHLSDLHLVPSQRRKIDWVRDLDTLHPDLVVDTGDNWAHPEALGPLLHALEPLLARPGAFVMGSNDYYGPVAKNPAKYLRPGARRKNTNAEERALPADLLTKELLAAGWIDLDNARDELTVRGTRLDLVGTDDAHIGRDRYPARGASGPTADPEAPSSDRETRSPSDTPAVRVGVTHAPYSRVLRPMLEDGVELAIAGHTHGGQLAVPGWGALVTNCDLETRKAKGLHGWPGARPDAPGGEDSMWLHVSAGLGTSPYTPVRFACRPEATLLTLVARDA